MRSSNPCPSEVRLIPGDVQPLPLRGSAWRATTRAAQEMPGWALKTIARLACIGALSAFAQSSNAPLADAAEQSDWDTVRALSVKHHDPNLAQVDGMTALHWAAYHDHPETAKLLVRLGAQVSPTNRYGVTPLSLACENGNAVLVELLLARGADPNTALRGGETVLMTAARTGRIGAVNALLDRGARVDSLEKHGQSALMWAAAEGHADVVQRLLDAGADPRIALPDTGFTAWFFAAREGRSAVIRVLLAAGADVHEAMQPRRTSFKLPRKGTSALILAVENGHFELALDLVRAGADPNDQRSGFTPLHVMSWVRKPPRGEDEGDPPPLGSGSLNSLQFIRELVKHGAEVNARLENGRGGPGQFDRRGTTPFFLAAATADIDFMRLLVELGADPLINNLDNCTPLMAACGIGVGAAAANETAGEEPEVLEAARMLLGWGVEVNAVDANGETAMHGASYKNLPKVVRFLADHGARMDVWDRKNRWGWTPLLIAEGHRPGNFKPSLETAEAIRQVMLQAGATPPPPSPPPGT